MNHYPINLLTIFKRNGLRRGVVLGGILLLALIAFEIFNFSTTQFAFTDLLGTNLRFAWMDWATILSVAFCGIDFAGLARLFTPEAERVDPGETWYLFGAWMLAALMNATLTWWGVALAVRSHVPEAAGSVLDQQTLFVVIPVFVAIMVLVIRVLIIGIFAKAGDRIFNLASDRRDGIPATARRESSTHQPDRRPTIPQPARPTAVPFKPVPKPEPTYHPVGLSASPQNKEDSLRK